MKNKKVVAVALSAVLLVAAGIGATLAYFTDKDEKTNVITMGDVDIDFDEPNYPGDEDNNEIENVKPGDLIVKDPTITVVKGSEDCYLRAKITYSPEELMNLEKDGKTYQEMLEETIVFGTDANITEKTGIVTAASDWVKSEDGYFYYQNKVEKNDDADQKVVFFSSVTIPSVWGNEIANKSINLTVEVEAIQADNMEGQLVYDANQIIGWGDVTVEELK